MIAVVAGLSDWSPLWFFGVGLLGLISLVGGAAGGLMLAEKLEPAEVFHEVLDYRWYASQRENREVPLLEATWGYIADVLRALPDEDLTDATRVGGDERQLVPLAQQLLPGATVVALAGPEADTAADTTSTAGARLRVPSM